MQKIMPESSEKRENRKKEKRIRRTSLGVRTLRTVILGALFLCVVTFGLGIWLYTDALLGEYETEAFMLAQGAAKSIKDNVEIEAITKEVMDKYRKLPEAERQKTGTKEYRSRFSKIEDQLEYKILIYLLAFHKQYSNDVEDVYYGVYDRETKALVYVADPATEKGMVRKAGDWEPLEKKELDKFLDWDGKGKLFDISDTEDYGWLCTAGVPVRDKKGNIIGFALADITLKIVLKRMGYFAANFLIAVLVVVLIFSILVMRHFRKTMVHPINQIAEAAYSYTNAQHDDVMTERYFEKLDITTGDEIENLSEVMKEMENEIAESVERLTAVTAEKERINTELDVASNIQSGMLPHTFPIFPDREEFDIYATMRPAKEVGGDFYDIFMVDKDHLVMVMADVSGKGIPAALFMMASKIMLKIGRAHV